MPPKKEKQQLITETFRKSRSSSVVTSGPRSRSSRKNIARSESVGPAKYKQKEVKPKDTTKVKPKEKQVLQDTEKESTATSLHSTPKLNKNVGSLLTKLQHMINKFGEQNRFSIDKIKDAQAMAYENTVNSRKMHNTNQKQILQRMIINAESNMDRAPTYEKLLFNVGPSKVEAGPSKGKSKQSEDSFPIFPLGTSGDMTFDEEGDIIPDSQHQQPVLSESQLKHIKDVVDIMEKEPKLKSDIHRTITEELTKGYINPDQFKHFKQKIDEADIKLAPEAIRVKKTPKPRAKKSSPVDTPIIPMDIETSSNLPKGNIKDNQKKKTKVITL
ncbi:MAG: hypothetical protein WCP46_07710 [Alphaproteobacteria bacterium]